VDVADGRYIQWLFPIQEQGLNGYAPPLQPHEADIIRTTPQMQTRLLSSLKLMLDFYGMAVSFNNLLIITRHPDPEINEIQYDNLNRSYHNYLRLTRIFKALVELGQADYVPSILFFILSEQSENEELKSRALRDSMDRYWVYCMREREAQACVATAIKWVRDGKGTFTEEMYRRIVEGKLKDGVWKFEPPPTPERNDKWEEKKNGNGLRKMMKRYSMKGNRG
jgi:Opioid growth factor receptor (OGFr) conserved region